MAFAKDENQKTRFDNDRGGTRISGAMSVTGKGANIIVCDDLHDVMEGESALARAEAVDCPFQHFQLSVSPGADIVAERVDALGSGLRLILRHELGDTGEAHFRNREPEIVI